VGTLKYAYSLLYMALPPQPDLHLAAYSPGKMLLMTGWARLYHVVAGDRVLKLTVPDLVDTATQRIQGATWLTQFLRKNFCWS
jgi:hypothetical protein